MNIAEEAAQLRSECECVTNTIRDDGCVTVEQQCSAEFLSMLDTVDKPAEHVALVTVRTVIEPNSARRWPHNVNRPHCVQQFFFDTRRSFHDLRLAVASHQLLNHMTYSKCMPLQT